MKHIRQIIREAISKSYNEEVVMKHLNKILGDDEIYETDGSIKINLTFNNHKIIGDVVKKMENLFGWYLVGAQGDLDEPFDSNVEEIKQHLQYNANEMAKEYGKDMDDLMVLHFLPKYGYKTNVPDMVYHVTEKHNLEKILRYGLVPKTKNKKAYHPDRVYLATNLSRISDLYNDMNFDVTDPVIIKIDLSDVKDHMEFYKDEHFPTGVYTLSNIGPERIAGYSTP